MKTHLSVAVLLPITSISIYFFIQICASIGLVNLELKEDPNLQYPSIEHFRVAFTIDDYENSFIYTSIPPASPVSGTVILGTSE